MHRLLRAARPLGRRRAARIVAAALLLINCGGSETDSNGVTPPSGGAGGRVAAAGSAGSDASGSASLAGLSAGGGVAGGGVSQAGSGGAVAGKAGDAGDTSGAAGEGEGGAGGGSDGTDCLDLTHPLQLDYFLHVPINKHLARAARAQAAEWYEEDGNVQRFGLAKGELNQVDGKATGRVEAFGESWRSKGEWHEFAATYRLTKAGGAAIFQLKAPSPIDWEVQITHSLDGSIVYQPRRNPSAVLGKNMVGKDFRLRVRSNGKEVEVYYDCQLVERRAHPMDPSGDSSYAFRWGLYPGTVAEHDMSLEVRGASWN